MANRASFEESEELPVEEETFVTSGASEAPPSARNSSYSTTSTNQGTGAPSVTEADIIELKTLLSIISPFIEHQDAQQELLLQQQEIDMQPESSIFSRLKPADKLAVAVSAFSACVVFFLFITHIIREIRRGFVMRRAQEQIRKTIKNRIQFLHQEEKATRGRRQKPKNVEDPHDSAEATEESYSAPQAEETGSSLANSSVPTERRRGRHAQSLSAAERARLGRVSALKELQEMLEQEVLLQELYNFSGPGADDFVLGVLRRMLGLKGPQFIPEWAFDDEAFYGY